MTKSVTASPSPRRYDRIDASIIRALQRHGRATMSELSEVAHISESSCLRRVRQLERDGVIERYSAVVAQDRIGLPLNVFVSLTLKSQAESILREFEAQIARIPEVIECFLMTGSADYLVRLVVRDVADLERVHATRLTKLSHVDRVTSSIAMRQVVRLADMPIHEIT